MMDKSNGKIVKKNKNNKKIKKKSVKIGLESPFGLDWPALDYGQYSDIVSTLKESLEQVIQQGSETSSLESCSSKTAKAKAAAASGLIFGFNAVMRALEKRSISGVLVNADAKPNFLLKSFIPVCSLKSIPLIPVKGLSDIIFKVVGIKSTLALGLSNVTTEEASPLRPLVLKCSKAFGFDQEISPSSSEGIFLSNGKRVIKEQEIECGKFFTNEEIQSLHLTRKEQNERIFKPAKSLAANSDSFIGIGNTDEVREPEYGLPKILKEKRESTRLEKMDFSFFIDTGDQNNESAVVAKNKPQYHYVSTKIKRIKSNPNRR